MVRLYNTLSRKKETFKPLKGKTVRLYTCGPTVYHYIHIGNIRSYIFADTLKRVLRNAGYKVKHVMNITDVGHLTSDADEGEDKMSIGAAREKKTVWEIAQFYIDSVKENIADVGILSPDIWCRATDHIFQQIALIQKLEKKGYTYTAGGNVYFDTSRLKDYGMLAGLKKRETSSVSRVEKDVNKKNPNDFVLWFTKSKFQDQDMKWESPWGVGYPGWHIECSAMSTYYLGQPFDIHTGGIDLIPVHHTNEIAQSEAAEGKTFANTWMHNEFIVTDSKKMAKSSGDFISLAVLKDKNYDPLAYRFFCLQTHYRQQLNFTWQAMDAAQHGYRSLRENVIEFMRRAEQSGPRAPSIGALLKKTEADIDKALADDLGTPQALALLFDLITEVYRREKNLGKGDYQLLTPFLEKVDAVFGLNLTKKQVSAPDDIRILVEQREHARREKRWSDADALRLRIEQAGYRVDDTDSGPKLVKL